MRLPLKIMLICFGITALLTFIFTAGDGLSWINLFDHYGFVAIATGAICAIVSITLFATGKVNYSSAQGFLASAGLLLITGFFAFSQISFGR